MCSVIFNTFRPVYRKDVILPPFHKYNLCVHNILWGFCLFSVQILLNELGFDEGFLTPLREQYLTPLARLLFPEQGGGNLDSHKAFVVTYKMDEDLDLNYHYDNAEVTINVSLGKEFCDGVLYFGDMRTVRKFYISLVNRRDGHILYKLYPFNMSSTLLMH